MNICKSDIDLRKVERTNLKEINNKRTLVNLYLRYYIIRPISMHFYIYNVFYQQHIKIMIKIHTFQIYLDEYNYIK